MTRDVVGRVVYGPRARTATCARCYGVFPSDTMVRSIHTKLSYCADFAACDRRLGKRIHREEQERRKKATA